MRFVELGVERGANSVGIRLQRSDYVVVWPTSQDVHRDASAPAGTCWRCDGIAPGMVRASAVPTQSERADHDA